jgi:hypothetical protein
MTSWQLVVRLYTLQIYPAHVVQLKGNSQVLFILVLYVAIKLLMIKIQLVHIRSSVLMAVLLKTSFLNETCRPQ